MSRLIPVTIGITIFCCYAAAVKLQQAFTVYRALKEYDDWEITDELLAIEPPTNLRVEMDDGRIIPVDSIYVGRNTEGQNVWEVETPMQGTVVALLAAELPPHTDLHFKAKVE